MQFHSILPKPDRESFGNDCRLEDQPQRYLNVARTADLIQSAEAPSAFVLIQTAAQHLDCLAKLRVAEIAHRQPKIRMVQYIEQLRSELEPYGFAYGEVPMQRKIPLPSAEASQCIPSKVTLS